MVGNISNSPRNIPRLRTCNFMAALEPYVEANGGAILNNTLDILTRIKIGVVFETKGLLSEDTSSSQIAVPIWQTVVERVTGLISNELKDGHDIEWKEENGAYKTSILKNLKLIEMVYYALENQNAQAVYVKQSRKDIASVLIDANVIPKICGVLTDLHHHTLEIIDHGRNKILSLVAQRILWAYTDTVRGFGEYVANITGFLEFIIAKLASESKTHLQLDKEVMLEYYQLRFQRTRVVQEIRRLSSYLKKVFS